MKLKHIKSGVVYTLVCEGKLKINGSWILCITYKNDDGEYFTRPKSDFSGFEIV